MKSSHVTTWLASLDEDVYVRICVITVGWLARSNVVIHAPYATSSLQAVPSRLRTWAEQKEPSTHSSVT